MDLARTTVEEFEALAMQDERRLESIGGEVVEMVSNNYASAVAANFIFYLKSYLLQKNINGFVTGADGGYKIGAERYMPDAGLNLSPMKEAAAWQETPPDLAVEVVSPSDKLNVLSVKISHYLQAGVIVWVVYPDEQEVHYHEPGQVVKVFRREDTLTGGNLLPEFAVPVNDLFPPLDEES
jgi:Uma2 family endonuclease